MSRIGRVLTGALAVLALACSGSEQATGSGDELQGLSRVLAREILIVDTHVDVPYRLNARWADITERTEDGHFDFPRAREGGLDAPFMSIYVPASYQETGGAREFADKMIDMVEGFQQAAPDKFVIATSPDEVREAFEAGLVALPMGMENGAPVEDLGLLEHFYDRGIRYITLTHSENNQICDSSYADDRTWNGLSPFGREVVAEMNRLGIMIDVSHVSDEAFEQVMELTRAPVIASHSSCRAFTPGFERNMSDAMIQRLAASGGVIQINFGSAFLTEAAQKQSSAAWQKVGAYLEEHGLDWDSDEADQRMKDYWAENPRIDTHLSDVADHIDHVVKLVGVEHVGLGSDYDGVSSLPVGLEDVSTYPALIEELLIRGYDQDAIRAICGENLMRVWTEVERVARESAEG